MKTHLSFPGFGNAILAVLLGAFAPSHMFAENAAQIFATPGEAVTALGRATAATNQAVLGTIFGDAAKQLVNPDTVQGASELMEFAAAFNVTNRLVRESDTRMVLKWREPGHSNSWSRWRTAGSSIPRRHGRTLNRRIGRNELMSFGFCGPAGRPNASIPVAP
jgi:hypothetical protein